MSKTIIPGIRALGLGANGFGNCECGNVEFFLMVKVDHKNALNVLVATQCTKCGKEAPVPMDKPGEITSRIQQ